LEAFGGWREVEGTREEDTHPLLRKLVALTNEFYTLIPHDFGARDPTMINTREVLDTKMKLMEALIDIEIAATLMSDVCTEEGRGREERGGREREEREGGGKVGGKLEGGGGEGG
jgi:hypothetical protein